MTHQVRPRGLLDPSAVRGVFPCRGSGKRHDDLDRSGKLAWARHPQAYEKGLIYNRNLEAAQRQVSLGWQPRLTARILQGLAAEMELVLIDTHGAPLTNAEVRAFFKRPTQDGTDFEVALATERPGTYRAGFELPMVGLWDIHVTIRRGGDLFVHDERVMLR